MHRFPMDKYDLVPQQLLHEGIITHENRFEPEDMGLEVILQTHDAEYVNRMKTGNVTAKEMRKIGFPYSTALLEREVKIMHGSVQAAVFALDNGIAFNMAGGTHHAYADKGEGFCIFNDIAISANYLLTNKLAMKILVVDLDVHQGNGTAALFSQNNKVFTFSMHGRNNYPAHKEKSDLDIDLEDGIRDDAYLQILDKTLSSLIDQELPDFIMYQSGVDILETDKLGKLKITLEGCKERDKIVLEVASKNEIPLLAVMGGGYSADIKQIIEAHAALYRLAADLY